MGCSASSQARAVETSPQPVQVAAQTATNQRAGGSSASPNVDQAKSAQIESTTTESVQQKSEQAEQPKTGI